MNPIEPREHADLNSPRQPDILAVRVDGHDCALDLHLPPTLAWFAHHFDGFPVLPGVVQLQWALGFAAEHLGTPHACRQLEMLKFQRLLRPGDQVQLQLSWRSERGRLQFAYRQGAMEFASGRFVWGQGND